MANYRKSTTYELNNKGNNQGTYEIHVETKGRKLKSLISMFNNMKLTVKTDRV